MKKKSKSGLFKFAAGLGIGAALGALFAPKTGKENREDLKKYTIKLLEDIKSLDKEEVKENYLETIERMRGKKTNSKGFTPEDFND